MTSVDRMIDFALSKHHKVTYSMAYPQRLGPEALDCSSFVYYALIAGGFLPKGARIGNTESLYKLKGRVFREIYDYRDVRRGDIFIRGIEGHSDGAYGHTGIFLRKGSIIHCNYTNNGVSINDETSFIGYYLNCRRSGEERYFRPIGKISPIRGVWKKGCALVHAITNVRERPSTNSDIITHYCPGDKIYYDYLLENEGYFWLSYIGRDSGLRRYVAYKDSEGNSWIDI